MSKNILKSLPELIQAGIITNETASRIELYYKNRKGVSQNKLIIAFGILGAILIGLGIILMIAHNWDNLSRTFKTVFVILPMLAGQIVCGYTLLKKKTSIVWRESSAIFLFLAIGACISLLSQIYILGGTLQSFILTWMLLGLPLIYLMQSSVASLFYISGITYYACLIGYWNYPFSSTYIYWLLLLLAMPFYYMSLIKRPESNFMVFHHWFIPVTITIVFGSIGEDHSNFMFVAYIVLFGFLGSIGNFNIIKNNKIFTNGYLIIGAVGLMVLFFILSFNWFWEDMSRGDFALTKIYNSPEFYSTLFFILLIVIISAYQIKKSDINEISPITLISALFLLVFLLGYVHPYISLVLVNIVILGLSIYNIWKGINNTHLGILNLGLITLTILIVCRFFDTDLSFVFRGMVFILLGIGFFIANYYLLKKRKTDKEITEENI